MSDPFAEIKTNQTPITTFSVTDQISSNLETEQINRQSTVNQRDNDRALDIADSLLDVGAVISKIEDPSLLDKVLVQTVANSAVAGTDIPASDLIPSTMGAEETGVSQQGLIERVGQTLTAFSHGIVQTFDTQVAFAKASLVQLRQNKAALAELAANWPIPDNPIDDVPRTEILDTGITAFLVGRNGQITTCGDFIYGINDTIVGFRQAVAITEVMGNRLMQVYREVLPAKVITDPADLNAAIEICNKNLYSVVNELWQKRVQPSDLTTSRGEDGNEIAETQTMLGAVQLMLKYKPNPTQATVEETTPDTRSTLIQSLRLEMPAEPTVRFRQRDMELSGISNAAIRGILEKLSDFIQDIEKYLAWCLTTSEIAVVTSKSDVNNIARNFSYETVAKMPKPQAESYYRTATAHVSDMNEIIKLTTDITTKPVKYANELITSLTVLLSGIQNMTPKGNYNQPKPRAV